MSNGTIASMYAALKVRWPRTTGNTVPVDSAMSHVAETAPFLAPPLDLDKNKHGSRRISTPPVTMGLLSRLRAAPFDVLM